MGEKFNRFKVSLKQTLDNLGKATEKTLKGLDSKSNSKLDKDLEKAIHGIE